MCIIESVYWKRTLLVLKEMHDTFDMVTTSNLKLVYTVGTSTVQVQVHRMPCHRVRLLLPIFHLFPFLQKEGHHLQRNPSPSLRNNISTLIFLMKMQAKGSYLNSFDKWRE